MASRRAGGWQDCSEQNPCPCCQEAGRGAHPGEGNTYCSWNRELEKTGSEAFTCCKGGGEVTGWRIFSKSETATVYVPRDAKSRELSPAMQAIRAQHEAQRAAETENFREAARKKGKAKWMLCGNELVLGEGPGHLDGRGPHHPRIVEYVKARGIELEDLPGGQLPRTLKYHGSLRDGVNVKEPKKDPRAVFFELPAMVCLAVRKDRKFGAVQRIYLDPAGEPKKAPPPAGVPDKSWDPKRAQGSLSGAAVRLHSPPVTGGGVLILTEGVETGLACLAATHAGVWACVSTSGLKTIELDDNYVCEHGPVETVIIAADCDRANVRKKEQRPGQEAAAACARRLSSLYPQLTIRVAVPTPSDAPGLFEDGEPKGKSVDWLDVYNASGKERVCVALLEHSIVQHKGVGDNTAGSGSWGGDDGRGIGMLGGDLGEPLEEGMGILPLARTLMLDWRDYSPQQELRPGSRWYMVDINNTPYLYHDGELPRYVQTTEAALRGRAWPKLQRYPIWDGDVTRPLNPDKKMVDSVVSAMRAETAIETKNLSVWLPATFDNKGKAMWAGDRPWVDPEAADWHIPCRNGILDVNALDDKVVKLRPSTPLLFTTSCRPFAVDAELLRRLLRATDDEADQLTQKHAPAFSAYLESVSGGDRVWKELALRAIGYALTPDKSYEVIFLLIGASGSGKSTFLDIVAAVVGEDGYVTATLSSLTGDFGLVPLVGKNVVALSDAGAGRSLDGSQALEIIKILSGGDKVTVQYKGKNEMPTLRLPCKVFIATNDMPSLPDSAGALERRLIPLPFPIPLGRSADRTLKTRVVEEAPFIFLLALRALVRLRRDKEGFKLTARGLALVQEIKETNAPMYVFYGERCEGGVSHQVRKADFRAAYNEWAEKNGHKALSMTAITKALRAILPTLEVGQEGYAGRKPIYIGLQLLPEGTVYQAVPPVAADDGSGGSTATVSPAPPDEDEPPF